jgi:transaldolase
MGWNAYDDIAYTNYMAWERRKQKMQIFIDSSNIKEIEKWLPTGAVDGVTTNPSILYKDGISDIEGAIKDICDLVFPRPVSVEVTTDDLEGMLGEAVALATLAKNIVIKIPQSTSKGEPCYSLMHKLERGGIKVNATVAMSIGQVIMSAKAEATYISIFAGRLEDEGGDACRVINDSVEWLEDWDYTSEIIVGSIRSVGDVLRAARAGAHIITIPPQFLSKMVKHNYTMATVKQFIEDAKKIGLVKDD